MQNDYTYLLEEIKLREENIRLLLLDINMHLHVQNDLVDEIVERLFDPVVNMYTFEKFNSNEQEVPAR